MRGRPKDAKPEETAAKIVTAAVELFAKNGYAGTSIRTIAATAGTSVGTLQYHFPSKDVLYSASMRAVYEPLAEMLEGAYSITELPLEEALREATIQGFRFIREYHLNIRLIYRDFFDRGSLHPDVVEATGSGALQLGAQVIASRNGGQPIDYVMSIQSGVFILIRYALFNVDDLKAFFKIEEEDPWPIVESYLARTIPALILMASPEA